MLLPLIKLAFGLACDPEMIVDRVLGRFVAIATAATIAV